MLSFIFDDNPTAGEATAVETFWPPPYLDEAKSPTAHVQSPATAVRIGEERDDYPATIAHLNDNWRVIECQSGIQWILQKKRGGPNHWRGRSFCRTREALLRCVHEHAGQVDGAVLAIMRTLPEWLEEATS
jgi:hypothetical protein